MDIDEESQTRDSTDDDVRIRRLDDRRLGKRALNDKHEEKGWLRHGRSRCRGPACYRVIDPSIATVAKPVFRLMRPRSSAVPAAPLNFPVPPVNV
jgi:hypothetical protein